MAHLLIPSELEKFKPNRKCAPRYLSQETPCKVWPAEQVTAGQSIL